MSVAASRLLACAVLLASQPAFAQPHVVTATQDTYITEYSAFSGSGSNHGSDPWLVSIGATGGYHTFPLVRFDLGSLAGHTATTAGTLELYLAGGIRKASPRAISIKEVLTPWSPGTVTFANFGGEYGVQADEIGPSLDTRGVQYDFWNRERWIQFTVPQLVLQRWIDQPTQNYGLFVHNQVTLTAYDLTFAATEHANGAYAPRLTFASTAPAPTISTPEPATWTLLGAGLAALAAVSRRRSRRTQA